MEGPRESLEDFAMEEYLGRAMFGELLAMTLNSILVHRFIDRLRETGYQVPIISSTPQSLSDDLDMAIRIEDQCRRWTAAAVMTVDVADHQLGSLRTETWSWRNNPTNPRSPKSRLFVVHASGDTPSTPLTVETHGNAVEVADSGKQCLPAKATYTYSAVRGQNLHWFTSTTS